MTFTGALVVVLAALGIALGLLCYYLLTRVHLLEQAVAGGMRSPSRTLSREEFGRRFTVARHRAEFAEEIGTGVVVFLDDGLGSADILRSLAQLGQRRGFHLAFRGAPPNGELDLSGFAILDHLGERLDTLGVGVLPFGLVVDGASIIEARPLGSSAALDMLLLEVS